MIRLSGDNITAIAIAGIAALQTIVTTIAAIALRRTRTKVDTIDAKVTSVDTKVSGVATSVDKVHALVDSRHSELKGELNKANEVTEKALKMVIDRDGVPPSQKPNPNSRDD